MAIAFMPYQVGGWADRIARIGLWELVCGGANFLVFWVALRQLRQLSSDPDAVAELFDLAMRAGGRENTSIVLVSVDAA